MRRHLNTIYVTSDGAYCRKDGANIVVEVDQQERGRAPIHVIGGLVCLGRASISPSLMNACTEAGVTISFLTEHGRFLARVEGPRSGNVLVRRTQHRAADDPNRAMVIAKGVVAAKLANQRTVMRRALRDHGDAGSLADAEMRITHVARRALTAADMDILRGCEGEGAALYFGAFNAMIRHDVQNSPSRAVRVDRRSTGLMRCCRFYMPCWATIAEVLWKASVSTPRSAFCMPIAPAG